MINICTWLWSQPNSRTQYTAEHVNIWARMVSRNVTIPHQISCVTDMPQGIDPSINIIPLPSWPEVNNHNWRERQGMPQCYRRLDMFRRDAAKTYGKRFVSMDLDCVITGNLDKMLSRKEDFVIMKAQSKSRPYCGTMFMLSAGARPQVYERWTPDRSIEASSVYLGSDQAWMAYCLGWMEPTWFKEDGAYYYNRAKWTRNNIPEDIHIWFFCGGEKPWTVADNQPVIAEHYR